MRRAIARLAMAAAFAAAAQAPAWALSDPIGIWTLSQPGSSRQCRLQLRGDATATGQAVAMPPGCHRAFPILSTVRSWSVPDGVHLALNDEVGANILMFDDAGDGHLQAAGPEGDQPYLLTPVGPGHAALAPQPAAALPAPTRAAVAPSRPALSATAVAGHYAVMRGSRDTGCMVTLDDPAHGTQASLKARLAPACRDQGISIFDPVGWALKAGRLVLQARKGHTADFTQDETGVWVKDAKGGQPLGLKRL